MRLSFASDQEMPKRMAVSSGTMSTAVLARPSSLPLGSDFFLLQEALAARAARESTIARQGRGQRAGRDMCGNIADPMAWIRRNLRGNKVFVKAKPDGKPAAGPDGRVDVKYK